MPAFPILLEVLQQAAAREHEVFTRVKTAEPWMRCQHGKRIVEVQAHWSDAAPFTVTTSAGRPLANSTQRFTRWLHVDGSESASFEWNRVSKCGACGALDTLSTVQEAYGDRTTCSACGMQHWYDIGD